MKRWAASSVISRSDRMSDTLMARREAPVSLDKTIYLDHHATTPVDPKVVEAMIPFFTTHFGNPSGTESAAGRKAANALKAARGQVSQLIGADPVEIIFTSGATESNNLAIIGAARALVNRTDRRKVFTTPVEHKSVLQVTQALAPEGFDIQLLPVDAEGRVILEEARRLINNQTLLVSVQLANNEIGTIQPLAQIAELAHSAGALFHTDAAQAIGKLNIDVYELGVDLLSISAHKFYGPKGVGALYVRNGVRGFPVSPLMFGGGQEFGLRPGTVNVPGVVGLGAAAELAFTRLSRHVEYLLQLRDTFQTELLELYPAARINGCQGHRLPNNCSISFPGLDAQALLAQTPALDLSTGSACTAGAVEPSHVLEAVGLSRSEATSTVRVGFGAGNTLEDARVAALHLSNAARHLGTFSSS
jgi:cysteine desulfurase